MTYGKKKKWYFMPNIKQCNYFIWKPLQYYIKKSRENIHHFSHIHESYKIMRTLALNMPSMQNAKQD